MIYNISYRDREIIREINNSIGKPFGVIERFKMKGIGSPRFILDTASEDVLKKLPSDEGAIYDKEIFLDAKNIIPTVTWGTSPEHALPIDGNVPDPSLVKNQ